MQPLSDTDADVLRAPALQVSAGCELLAPDLTVVEDISDALLSGSVERNLYARIHGTCKLELDRPLVWGVDLVRPYMSLSDGVTTVRFNVGVFSLTTPDSIAGSSVPTFSCQGYDRLYLLDREVGEDYSVTAGTTYRDALLQAFTDAEVTGVLIDGAAADDVLPADKDWPLIARSTDPDQTSSPVTWLRIVNDLLLAINFRAVWADENGLYRCSAYQPPEGRAAEFTFDADDERTTVGEFRTLVEDVWKTPNRWVFRQSNRDSGAPPATEGDGIYTVENASDGPTSIAGRGMTWTTVIDYEAATQAVLEGLGDRRVALDRRTTSTVKLTTAPFPPAGHADVYALHDSALGPDRKVQAVQWQLDLLGADTAWTWETI